MAVPVAANSQIPTNFGITFYEKVQSKWANWYWVLKKGCLLSHLVFKCPKQSAAVAVQYLGLHNKVSQISFQKASVRGQLPLSCWSTIWNSATAKVDLPRGSRLDTLTESFSKLVAFFVSLACHPSVKHHSNCYAEIVP